MLPKLTMLIERYFRFILAFAVIGAASCKATSPTSPGSPPSARLVVDSHVAEVSVDTTPGYAEQRQYYSYETIFHFEGADGFIHTLRYDLGDRRVEVHRLFTPEVVVEVGKEFELGHIGHGTAIFPAGSKVVQSAEFHGVYILDGSDGGGTGSEEFTLLITDTVTVGYHTEDEHPEDKSEQVTIGARTSRFARWSPAGNRLAYESRASSNESHVYILEIDGESSPVTSDYRCEQPSWSPNGDEIVYRSWRDNRYDIWAVSLVNGEDRRVTDSPTIESNPAWSPDGRRIAFESFDPGDGQSDIWIVPLEGGEPTKVTRDRGSDVHPSWSPDGTHIAFSSNRSGSWDIWTISLTGGTLTRITIDPGNELAPSWSPDGNSLAFQSDRHQNWDIFVVSTADGTERQITSHPGDENNPDCLVDCGILVFDAHRRGSTQLWIIRY